MATNNKRLERLERFHEQTHVNRQSRKSYDEVYPPGWSPKTAAQKGALGSKADILLFGGSAGSLKTETMLVDAARESLNPNLRAIIFRQQFTQMTDIVDKMRRLYTPMGASYTTSPFWMWTFSSGATICLGYISSDRDIWKYMGPRYSFIGFDESTFHTEHQVRSMLGRLSSTDRRLRLRMRLVSNPGSIGAAWHKAMFLRGSCPIHNPKSSAQPGTLYWDAHWPSDQYPLTEENGAGFSVAFIPGRLSDHNLLDEKYANRLRMLPGALSLALEKGCWCGIDGAYFANWNASKMVIPYAKVGAEWWDSHFISMDYGFGKSSASAHLHVRTRDGRIKTIGEFVALHLPAYEFAREVVERFVTSNTRGQRRKIVAAYLDPANFRDIGDGHTIANQINEVLEPYDLQAMPASPDRTGGWQLMYQLLQKGKWLIADTCPRLIESIPTRIHDDTRPGDLRKVPGDPLDDVADSARYGIYSFVNASEPPQDHLDDVRDLVQQGDLTSAMIRYSQHHPPSWCPPSWSPPIRIGNYARRRYGYRPRH